MSWRNPIGNRRTGPANGIAPFNSVTVASNVPPAGVSMPEVGYSAQPGWDACTGLGTPVGSELLALMQQIIGKTGS